MACGDDDAADDGGAGDVGSDTGGLACAIATVPVDQMIPTMTLGEADDYDPPDAASCMAGTSSGPDRVYGVEATDAGRYRITATPITPTFNVLLYVLETCDATLCLAGSDSGGPGAAETVELDLAAGQLAFIVLDTNVDDGDAAGGASTLRLELL